MGADRQVSRRKTKIHQTCNTFVGDEILHKFPVPRTMRRSEILMFREKLFYVVGRIDINWINECLIFCHNVQVSLL